jgi:hypothetical protein
MARASKASVEPQQATAHATHLGNPSRRSALPHEEIARRAHDLYLAHGSLDGFDKEDWFEAERMLNAEAAFMKGRA